MSLDLLATLAADPDNRAVRLICADWLAERGDPRGDWLRDDELWQWMKPEGVHPLARLQAALPDRDLATRQRAARALGKLGAAAAPAVPQLASLLDSGLWGGLRALWRDWVGPEFQHDNRQVRRVAIEALGNLGPVAVPALSPLLSALHDETRELADAAATALGQLGPVAVPRLRVILRGRAPYFARDGAAKALGIIGAPAAVAALDLAKFALKQPGNSAAEALRRIEHGIEPAVELLRQGLRHADSQTRWNALLACHTLGPLAAIAAPDLIAATTDLSTLVRQMSLAALKAIASPARSQLFATLNVGSVAERCQAVELLLLLDATEAVPALIAALPGAEAELSAVLRRTLAKLCARLLVVGTAEERRLAQVQLRDLGTLALPHLLPVINSVSPESACVAIGLIMPLGREAHLARPYLQAALDHEDETVRTAAAEALFRLNAT